MRLPFKGRNAFAFLFGRSKSDEVLAQYVIREHRRGRPLADVLEDVYVRNRSTPEQRARLLERPDVVAAIGRQSVADTKATVAGGDRRPTAA